jgi:hypothetical protein
MITFLGWLMFIGFGAWAVYEYREELKSKSSFKEIERHANERHDDAP